MHGIRAVNKCRCCEPRLKILGTFINGKLLRKKRGVTVYNSNKQ